MSTFDLSRSFSTFYVILTIIWIVTRLVFCDISKVILCDIAPAHWFTLRTVIVSSDRWVDVPYMGRCTYLHEKIFKSTTNLNGQNRAKCFETKTTTKDDIFFSTLMNRVRYRYSIVSDV